jgi:hypothetical protein
MSDAAMGDPNKAHALNVPGPFYVVGGCCTSCRVPDATAPDLFGYDPDGHCYVRRQPTAREEVERALRVIWGQELGCIRYAGDDAVLRHRLAEAGVGEQCDVPPPAHVRPVVRNQVTFETPATNGDTLTAAAILERLTMYLGTDKYRLTPVVQAGDGAQFAFSWHENNFHKVMAQQSVEPGRWRLRHEGNLAVSNIICDWLTASPDAYRSVSWFTEQELRTTGKGQPRPW